MNHNETARGGDAAIRRLNHGDCRLLQAEREPAAVSTAPRVRGSLEARR
jgi:hypothetical protein